MFLFRVEEALRKGWSWNYFFLTFLLWKNWRNLVRLLLRVYRDKAGGEGWRNKSGKYVAIELDLQLKPKSYVQYSFINDAEIMQAFG